MQLSALLLCLCVTPWFASAATKPNILFLLSDDQRPDTIHSLGNDAIITPHLDRLCAQGTAFTRAHIMGGMQGAICVPSRAMIMSGRTLFRCPEQPKGDHALWPATLAKSANYKTFQTGKWHNGPASLNLAFQDSKNTFFGGMTNDHWKIKLQDYNKEGKYPPAQARTGDKYDAEIFADSVIDFVSKNKSDAQPWFVWCSFTNPHDPRTPPEEYAKKYDLAKIPLPKNYMPTPPLETGVLGIRDEKLLPVPRTEQAVKKEILDYYATITHMDAQIGRILDTLDKTGQLANTLIIFAGDNGLAIGSHGLLGKQNVYQHSVGVPLILAGPGVPKNQRSDALVYQLDIFPTTCDLVGVPIPPSVEGQSFAPVFKNQPAPRTDLLFAYTKLHRGYRDHQYKLIQWTIPNQPPVTQLFDLAADPDELHDLSKDPAHSTRLAALTEKLKATQKSLEDPLAK